MKKDKFPVSEKYTLSVVEAAQYFGIGEKKMRRLAEDNLGVFAVYSGNRYLIIRCKFEEYLQKNQLIE
jgi:excisionase family DNA binding protein